MRIVFVTCPPDTGAELLRELIQRRLVAGGNLIAGVRSLYRWKGEICDDPEEILLMETSDARVPELMVQLKALHPYEVPKILTLDPAEVLPAYLGWVKEPFGVCVCCSARVFVLCLVERLRAPSRIVLAQLDIAYRE